MPRKPKAEPEVQATNQHFKTVVQPAKDVAPKQHFVTNETKGTVLHIGDGRRLAYGERAEVSPEIAKLFE